MATGGAAALALALALLAGSAGAVSITPTAQKSFNFTGNTTVVPDNWDVLPPFVSLNDSSVAPAPGCAPEQVRLTYWSSSGSRVNMLVTWATCGFLYDDSVTGPQKPPRAAPEVWLGDAPGAYTKVFKGSSTSYIMNFTAKGGSIYASPLIHHVLLKGLKPGATYAYKIRDLTAAAPGRHLLSSDDASEPGDEVEVSEERSGDGVFSQLTAAPRALLQDDEAAVAAAAAGGGVGAAARPPSDWGANPFAETFKVPGPGFPFKVGVWGDPAQLINETAILAAFEASNPDLLLMTGDIAYADNFENENAVPEWACFGPQKACPSSTTHYGPRWDSVARLFQPLISRRPVIYTNGNHEIEVLPDLSANQWNFSSRGIDYNARYPVPATPAQRSGGPRKFGPVTLKDKTANMYGATEVRGIAKIITITSYIPQDDFSTRSEQYRFLERELRITNRRRTPWLIIMMHAPWYSTFTKHYKEAECMRVTYEPLFAKYVVDLVISGHAHAYESVEPTYNWLPATDDCKPFHATVGDGCGDELTVGYVDIDRNIPKSKGPYMYCLNNATGVDGYQFNRSLPAYQKAACPTWDIPLPGNVTFCPSEQPSISRYRESVFGRGELVFNSATEAKWRFYRIDAPLVPADEVTITRWPEACGLRA